MLSEEPGIPEGNQSDDDYFWDDIPSVVSPSAGPSTDNENPTSANDAVPEKKKFTLISLQELENRPPPVFLVQDVIVKASTSLLTAKHRSFKTFLSLDLALCVAAGIPWHEKHVIQGSVIYVAAEGAGGLFKRITAWCIKNNQQYPSNFHIIDRPAQIQNIPILAEFIDTITPVQPALIVLDTLARCAVGLDENSAKDMGEFVEAVGYLAEKTGAHVMTIHHNNRNDEYRGSSALVAAVDTHLSVIRDGQGDILTLKFEKQKDSEEHDPIVFNKEPVNWRTPDGENMDSLVFTREFANYSRFAALQASERKVITDLINAYGADGATSTQWHKVCDGLSEKTFHTAKTKLEKAGYVHCTSSTVPKARGAKYFADMEKCAEFITV